MSSASEEATGLCRVGYFMRHTVDSTVIVKCCSISGVLDGCEFDGLCTLINLARFCCLSERDLDALEAVKNEHRYDSSPWLEKLSKASEECQKKYWEFKGIVKNKMSM
ncbi:hypothetical protein CBL_13731 [Carabus blaptoides fortunei]